MRVFESGRGLASGPDLPRHLGLAGSTYRIPKKSFLQGEFTDRHLPTPTARSTVKRSVELVNSKSPQRQIQRYYDKISCVVD